MPLRKIKTYTLGLCLILFVLTKIHGVIMKLTHNYRVIISAFDTRTDYSRNLDESFYPGSGSFDSSFWVGNFEYEVAFTKHYSREDYMAGKEAKDSKEYEVVFKVIDSRFSSDEEMVRTVSKMTGRPVDVREAKSFLEFLSRYDLTGLGESRPVLSGVINAIKQFVDRVSPSCLLFDAYEPKRRKFYAFLVNRLSSMFGYTHSSRERSTGRAQQFRVCFNSEVESRASAKAVPYFTKEDLQLRQYGDPGVDREWFDSGLKKLVTYKDEHFSFTGKKKKDEKAGTVFLYRAGQIEIWIDKNHQVYEKL
jgi:hypothetical protein